MHPLIRFSTNSTLSNAAATHSGETLLVLAGAGTGKTTTLCVRVAWLMAEGVPAERILLLTFTRRAGREMIERARTLAERVAPDAGRIVGGTFYSVAHRMVRVHASSLDLEAGFGVLDAGDAGDLLDLVRLTCRRKVVGSALRDTICDSSDKPLRRERRVSGPS